MESMLFWGHQFLGGLKHFRIAVRVWKTNLILEDIAHQNQMKIWPSPWMNFWPKRIFQWFCSPHTRLIWVRVTSSFSQNSNSTSKVIILELWTTSRRLWQSSWGHLHMKTSSTITGSGSNIFSSIWLPKGTNLKGIMLIFSSVVNKKFCSTSLITF